MGRTAAGKAAGSSPSKVRQEEAGFNPEYTFDVITRTVEVENTR